MEFVLTAWSERALDEHERRHKDMPMMEITAEWDILPTSAPKDLSDPRRIKGAMKWTAPMTPDLSPKERTAWLKKILREALDNKQPPRLTSSQEQ